MPWPSRIAKPIASSGLPQLAREGGPVALVPPQESSEVARPYGVVLVERLAVPSLGQVVLLLLLHLVVAGVGLVRGLDAQRFLVGHRSPSPRRTA